MKKIIFIYMVLFLTSCTNYFKDYYTGLSEEEIKNLNEKYPSTNTILKESHPSHFYQDENDLVSNGYLLIGRSLFNAGDVNKNDALKFGKKIGADIVMLYIQYTNTVNTVTPITLPDFTDVNTSYYNSYGGLIGGAKSTIYGSSTTYIPSSVRRYDYLAIYWKKNPEKPKIGIMFNNLSDEQKQRYKTNKGVTAAFIMNNSPAFKNDILKGDIISKINGKTIYDITSLPEIIESITNKSIVTFDIIRDGKKISKKIKID